MAQQNRLVVVCVIVIMLIALAPPAAAENQAAMLPTEEEEEPCILPPWLHQRDSGSGSGTRVDDRIQQNYQPLGIDCDDEGGSSDSPASDFGSTDLAIDDDDCINGSPLPQPVDDRGSSSTVVHKFNGGLAANDSSDDDCTNGSPLPQPTDISHNNSSKSSGTDRRSQDGEITDDDCINLPPLPQPADNQNRSISSQNGSVTADDGNYVNRSAGSISTNIIDDHADSINHSFQTPITSIRGTRNRGASSPEPNNGKAADFSNSTNSAAPRSAPTVSPIAAGSRATTAASLNPSSHVFAGSRISGSLRGTSLPPSVISSDDKGSTSPRGSLDCDEPLPVASNEPASPAPATTSQSTTPVPTTPPPSRRAPLSSNLFLRVPLTPHCPGDATPVSVEGVEGVFCVPGFYICASNRSDGACPDQQEGLLDGSHCGIVRTGVHGCKPGPRPQRFAEIPNCRDQGLEAVSVAGVGTFCSEKPVCSGSVFGKCPQAQFGLSFPSHCRNMSTGVFGCAV